jgi:Cdc6-like AAA superfamily ATPase
MRTVPKYRHTAPVIVRTSSFFTNIELKKPAFIAFTNKARDAIILEKPQSDEEIASMSYSGNKISKYAYSEILRITSKFLDCDPQPDDRITQTSAGSRVESVSSTAEAGSDKKDKFNDSEDPDILLSSLSGEQQRAAQRALSGQNLFITGSAGTGKSFLLKYIVQEARKQHSEHPDSVVVTAPTGVAAIKVGGATINSFAGYGLGKYYLDGN